jgi:hypothetical protein
MNLPSRRTATLALRHMLLALLALLLCAVSAHAQAKPAAAAKPNCAGEIPFGVKVVRLPDAEQKKVTLSAFSISPSKDPPPARETYDLSMRVKNGSANWCITSFSFTYQLGDARGQEWTAYEYPAVVAFKTTNAPLAAGHKPPPPHAVGMAPGKEETRVVFDLYNYIEPRPTAFFDGFHLISADINYCLGYPLTKSP